MKRIILLSLLILSYLPTFALAGFADEMENRDINLILIIISLVITQAICYILISFTKNKFTWRYRRIIARITNLIQKKNRTRWFMSWLLSSFIWSSYLAFLPMVAAWLMWQSCRVGFSEKETVYIVLGSVLIVFLPSIVMAIFLFGKRLRIKFLTGRQATAKLLSVTFQQIVGYFLFIIACYTPIAELFKSKVNEFEGVAFYIYPTPDGIAYVIESFFGVAALFTIPYILMAVIRLLRHSIHKIVRNKNNV